MKFSPDLNLSSFSLKPFPSRCHRRPLQALEGRCHPTANAAVRAGRPRSAMAAVHHKAPKLHLSQRNRAPEQHNLQLPPYLPRPSGRVGPGLPSSSSPSPSSSSSSSSSPPPPGPVRAAHAAGLAGGGVDLLSARAVLWGIPKQSAFSFSSWLAKSLCFQRACSASPCTNT